MNQVIELTDDTAIIHTAQPKGLGTKVELKVKLPDGVVANHLVIPGTVTRCDLIDSNGKSQYLLELKINEMSSVDQKILAAYREFLERKKVLAKVKVDLGEIQAAFDTFGSNLRELRKNAEDLRDNLRGTLELMKIKAEGRTTVH